MLDKIDTQSSEIETQKTVLDNLIFDATEYDTGKTEITRALFLQLDTYPIVKYHQHYLVLIPYPFFTDGNGMYSSTFLEYLPMTEIVDATVIKAWANVDGSDDGAEPKNSGGYMVISYYLQDNDKYFLYIGEL